MTSTVLMSLGKKLAKTVATTTLEGISYASDKIAEYSDNAQEWVENLDKKDTSAREERQAKRKSTD